MEELHKNINSNGVLLQDVTSVIEDVGNYLRFLNETGCKGFDCSEESIQKMNHWAVKKFKKQAPEYTKPRSDAKIQMPKSGIQTLRAKNQTVKSQEPTPNTQRPETLEIIQKDMGDCQCCNLSTSRNHILFGAGNPKAKLVFVGEAPIDEEDQSGEFFKGDVGELFVKIIRAIDFTPEQIYICNIVKCRPPAGRDPLSDEIQICLSFLKRQMMVIKPDFICALGNLVAQTLLETTIPIAELRGRFYDYMGAKLLPTFHPKYLLRYPKKKREAWDDMKMLMREINKDP